MRLGTYEVSVVGFPPVTYSALSPAKARSEAWRSFTSAYECTFKDFLRMSRVRTCTPPVADGYDYIRRNYGVDVKIGERVRLINEGQSSGLEGEVAYPGISTAHVHVLIDRRDYITTVHPNSIEKIEAR